MRRTHALVTIALVATLMGTAAVAPVAAQKPSLKQALASLQTPPAWYSKTGVSYDTKNPWSKARIEIRSLLSKGGDKARQGMKLTYLYKQKNDIGDGHEYPMYLFLGGETTWALVEYHKFLTDLLAKGPVQGHTNAFLSYASCFSHFGEYDKAEQVHKLALAHLPKPPWDIPSKADVYDAMGDLYAEKGDFTVARSHYDTAMKLLPTSKQPYGREKIAERIKKIGAKRALLGFAGFKAASLKDGTYSGSALGYKGDISVTVTIKGGRATSVKASGNESIEQGALQTIPARIINKQSLNVDAVTGATVTSQAVVAGAYDALLKAGLK